MGTLADKSKQKSSALLRVSQGLPSHLKNSENLGEYYQTLTDFNFLMAKIQNPNFGLQALIDDCDLMNNAEVLSHPDYNPEKVKKALNLIQNVFAADESRP